MFYEAGLIDSKDGIQLKVFANCHPEGFVVAKPKYIPADLVEFVGLKKRFMFSKAVNRFNLFTKKEIAEENIKRFKEKFPDHVFYSENHKKWFLGVPENKIEKQYDCQKGLSELMKIPDDNLDDYLLSTKKFAEFLLGSGIKIEDLGISHSTLLGNYTPGKSDIDVIVFGKENGWKVINFLEGAEHEKLRWKTEEDWAKYYKDRVVSSVYSEEEYVKNMVRKKDDGFFNNHVFSVFVVENEDELWYDWDAEHEPLGTVKFTGKVKEDYNSIVRPGFYELEDTKVLQGYSDIPIKRVVTWSRPFVLQAKKGENIEGCGLLEKVNVGEESFYQVVIGYFDTYVSERGEKEYLKALL